MNYRIVIPTAGANPEILSALIQDPTVDPMSIIIIQTSAEFVPPRVGKVIVDLGEINIQRWWSAGIAWAELGGAEFAIVLNDDVLVSGSNLNILVSQLDASRCALAPPGRTVSLNRSIWPLKRITDGAIWALRLSSGLRPNQSLRWAYGDDDLDIRARLRFGGLLIVPVPYNHVNVNLATSTRSDLLRLSEQDRKTFRNLHPITYFLRLPRILLVKLIRSIQRGKK